MAFLQFIFEMIGDQDITVVSPDKRKTIASEMSLRFFLPDGSLQVSLWQVKIEPKTVTLAALSTDFVNSLEGYLEFIDRSTIWIEFVAQELTDFTIDIVDLVNSEHEIKVLSDGTLTFKFEIAEGLVLQGSYDPTTEDFTFNRPATLTLNWSEFLLWHVFLTELADIAKDSNA